MQSRLDKCWCSADFKVAFVSEMEIDPDWTQPMAKPTKGGHLRQMQLRGTLICERHPKYRGRFDCLTFLCEVLTSKNTAYGSDSSQACIRFVLLREL